MTYRMPIAVLLGLLPALTAQEPQDAPPVGPAGETASSWTAEEGAALALLREIAARRDALRAEQRAALLQRVIPPAMYGRGYRLRFFVPDTEETLVPIHARTATDRWCAYAWPERYGEGGTRSFFVASEGPVLLTDNRKRRYGGEVAPEPTAALGRGGSETLRDVQRSPGVGEDGGFWQTVETLRLVRCRVQVVDEENQPADGVEVALLPPSGIYRPGRRAVAQSRGVPFPVPVGRGKTDGDGTCTVQGPPARGVELAIRAGPRWLALDGDAVQRTDHGLRIRMSLADRSEAQRRANESAAIATLKNILSAQAQCQASAAIDADQDGAGEYGFFAELAGKTPVRSDAEGGVGTAKITPPVLSRAFANVQRSRVERSGYLFQMFLRTPDKEHAAEKATGGGAGVPVDPDLAEVVWCCYAWPIDHGGSGNRTFFVDQAGDVLACDNEGGRYSGHAKAPQPGAAFVPGDDWAAAANRKGADGAQWTVVN